MHKRILDIVVDCEPITSEFVSQVEYLARQEMNPVLHAAAEELTKAFERVQQLLAQRYPHENWKFMVHPCEACNGNGFILASKGSGLQDDLLLIIERCDACDQFESDSEAVEACFNMAMEQERKKNEDSTAGSAL